MDTSKYFFDHIDHLDFLFIEDKDTDIINPKNFFDIWIVQNIFLIILTKTH